MFWKAIVVAVWVVIVERWQAYRKRRHQTGLPLKQNRDGVYEVSDWTANVDRGARWIREGTFVLAWSIWTAMAVAYLLNGWAGIEWLGHHFFRLVFPDLPLTASP